MIRIGIAEDNPFLAAAVKEKLSFFDDVKIKIVAENGQLLLDKLEKDNGVDLILMDIEMPVMRGIEATFQVKSKYPQIKVLMLTVFDDDENIFSAIKSGADGYLLKETNIEELYKSITETLEGGAAMTPSIAARTLRLLRNPQDFSTTSFDKEEIKLSAREVEVLEQLSKGLSNKLIADNLCLSPGTVRKHVENIYSKLQVHNKMEAVEKARSNRLI